MRDKPSACSPLLRGDGPETGVPRVGGRAVTLLAVPSYGAMALKQLRKLRALLPRSACSPLLRGDGPETRLAPGEDPRARNLAVPSYGAMALKLLHARPCASS